MQRRRIRNFLRIWQMGEEVLAKLIFQHSANDDLRYRKPFDDRLKTKEVVHREAEFASFEQGVGNARAQLVSDAAR